MAPAHKTVLVVDDDIDVRETLGEILADKGYDVAMAGNGAEALEYLHTSRAPAMILLDLTMPVMDGWTFLAERNRDSSLRSIPVIVISGQRGVATQIFQAYADYFEKPVRIDRLVDAMERLIH